MQFCSLKFRNHFTSSKVNLNRTVSGSNTYFRCLQSCIYDLLNIVGKIYFQVVPALCIVCGAEALCFSSVLKQSGLYVGTLHILDVCKAAQERCKTTLHSPVWRELHSSEGDGDERRGITFRLFLYLSLFCAFFFLFAMLLHLHVLWQLCNSQLDFKVLLQEAADPEHVCPSHSLDLCTSSCFFPSLFSCTTDELHSITMSLFFLWWSQPVSRPWGCPASCSHAMEQGSVQWKTRGAAQQAQGRPCSKGYVTWA